MKTALPSFQLIFYWLQIRTVDEICEKRMNMFKDIDFKRHFIDIYHPRYLTRLGKLCNM